MAGDDAAKTGAPISSEELVRQLELLDEKINAALTFIQKLRREKAELESGLAESEALRRDAAQRLSALLDRIDVLL
jgi:hypothetical protein